MKQTIEIEVPDGMKAIWKDCKVTFEDLELPLPKTWEEFCKIKKLDGSEAYISYDSMCVEIGRCSEIGGMERNCYRNKNLLSSKQAAEAHLALMQLHQLRDCYREGWEPDWNNDCNKYIIVKNRDKYVVFGGNWTNQFLSFQDRERAEEFLTNFRELIEQAGDLI